MITKPILASKTRIITLTGAAPVQIVEADWPIIAEADGDSFAGSDYGRRRQALQQGEVDTYKLRVRRHEDGRAIVYGVLDAAISAWGQPAGGESWRGGELVGSDADLAAAISRVGGGVFPERVVRACIADLPPTELR